MTHTLHKRSKKTWKESTVLCKVHERGQSVQTQMGLGGSQVLAICFRLTGPWLLLGCGPCPLAGLALHTEGATKGHTPGLR